MNQQAIAFTVPTSAKKIVRCNAPPVLVTRPSRYVRSACCQRLSSLRPFSITLHADFALQRPTSDPVPWLHLLCLMSNLNYLTP